MVSHLSLKILNKLEPIDKKIHSEPKIQEAKQEAQQASSKDPNKIRAKLQNIAEMMENQIPDSADFSHPGSLFTSYDSSETSGIYYTPIPSKSFSNSPSHLTTTNHDKSFLLQNLLNSKNISFFDLLGELQFSFIHFWLAQNLDGLNQWKRILDLIAKSEKQLIEWKEQKEFKEFVKTWKRQLKELPDEWFRDEEWIGGEKGEEVVGKSLKSIVEIFKGEDKCDEVEDLKRFVEEKFDVKEEELLEFDEEELPVMVTDVNNFFVL